LRQRGLGGWRIKVSPEWPESNRRVRIDRFGDKCRAAVDKEAERTNFSYDGAAIERYGGKKIQTTG